MKIPEQVYVSNTSNPAKPKSHDVQKYNQSMDLLMNRWEADIHPYLARHELHRDREGKYLREDRSRLNPITILKTNLNINQAQFSPSCPQWKKYRLFTRINRVNRCDCQIPWISLNIAIIQRKSQHNWSLRRSMQQFSYNIQMIYSLIALSAKKHL
jgi:hypothetical protein